MTETSETQKTVDLAALTDRMNLAPAQQQNVAAFADGSGPWTEEEAADLVSIWQNTDPETGVYTAPVTGDEDDEDERPAAELLERVRADLCRHVPGGGEQFLDRYLAQTRVELLTQVEAYGEAIGRAAMHLVSGHSRDTATFWAGSADAIKAEIMARFGGTS